MNAIIRPTETERMIDRGSNLDAEIALLDGSTCVLAHIRAARRILEAQQETHRARDAAAGLLIRSPYPQDQIGAEEWLRGIERRRTAPDMTACRAATCPALTYGQRARLAWGVILGAMILVCAVNIAIGAPGKIARTDAALGRIEVAR